MTEKRTRRKNAWKQQEKYDGRRWKEEVTWRKTRMVDRGNLRLAMELDGQLWMDARNRTHDREACIVDREAKSIPKV